MISRYYAVNALIKYGITKLPVSLDQIEGILRDSGWEIINYDLKDEGHIKLLEQYDVLDLARGAEAFTYKKGEEKAVFIRVRLSANERRVILAHEFGHIEMNHFADNGKCAYHSFGLIDEGREDEASNFALEFLAPVCILDRQRIKTTAAIESVTLLDRKRSQMVADEIRRHKSYSTYEKELCLQFEDIRPKAFSRWLSVISATLKSGTKSILIKKRTFPTFPTP